MVVGCELVEISVVAGVEFNELLGAHTGLVTAHEVVVLDVIVVTAETEDLAAELVGLELDVHNAIVGDDEPDDAAADVDDVVLVGHLPVDDMQIMRIHRKALSRVILKRKTYQDFFRERRSPKAITISTTIFLCTQSIQQ